MFPRPQACANSPFSSQCLLLALCARACGEDKHLNYINSDAVAISLSENGKRSVTAPAAAAASASAQSKIYQARKPGAGSAGFSPVLLSSRAFSALARLLRASLDQAAARRELLHARNCLVISALYAVRGAEYVSWLREAKGSVGGKEAGVSGGGGGADFLAVMADDELVRAAGALDKQQQEPGQWKRGSRGVSPWGGRGTCGKTTSWERGSRLCSLTSFAVLLRKRKKSRITVALPF